MQNQISQDPTAPRANLSRTDLFAESELKHYGRIIRRWLWLILLCAALGGGTAYGVSHLATPIYQASTTLLIDEAKSPATNYNDILTSERKARTYAELMMRQSVLDEVARRLDRTPAAMEAAISDIRVTPLRDTQLVRVEVEGVSPPFVAAVANAIPEVFVQELNQVQTERFAESKANLQELLDELSGQIERIRAEIGAIGEAQTPQEELELGRLQNALTQYQNNYTSLLQNLETLRLAEVQATDSIIVADAAVAPEQPVRPRTLVNTLLATIVGAMVALGLVFLREYLDDRIRSPRELQYLIDLPLLGTVAPFSLPNVDKKTRPGGLIAAEQPRHPVTEAYRSIRTNLQFANIDGTLRTLLVTSAVTSEGKTTTAGNLAVVLAQSGLTVAMVDADMRKPTVHKLFGVPNHPGLVDGLLMDEQEPLRYCAEQTVPNLRVLPCGKVPPNPSELLGSQRMRQAVERIQEQVDVLIFDAPPVLSVADARILSTMVDGVLLVVNSGTARGAIVSAVEALSHLDAPLFGIIFNRLTRTAASDYYYYSYYKNGYFAENEEPPDDANGTGRSGDEAAQRALLTPNGRLHAPRS